MRTKPKQVAPPTAPAPETLVDLDYIAGLTGRRFATVADALAGYEALPEAERFDPSVFFSRAFYRHRHTDVRMAGVDPLLHFLGTGFSEERCVHPLFDAGHLRAQLGQPQATVFALLTDFAAGRIAVSPHPLLDLGFIREQLGAALSARDIFRLVADAHRDMPAQPHPLFSPAYYALNGTPALRNALADYVGFQPGAVHVHPLFSPAFYLAGRSDDPGTPALLGYLTAWRDFAADTSLLADLKFINHQLALRQIEVEGDPITTALRHVGEDATPLLHPHIDPRIVDFAFGNLVDAATIPGRHRRCAAALIAMLTQPRAAAAAARPLVSVIILNYHKPAYTLLSVLAATNALRDLPHEIVVVENGGEPLQFEEMSRLLQPLPNVVCRKMACNLFYGEGNNIGIDAARGDNMLFLNNDCFLHHSFGAELRTVLRTRPDIHAIGTTLYFPDGRVQEFGGMISDCGQVVQRAKYLDASMLRDRHEIEAVGYASAACLLVSRRAIAAVAGFDPAFEPFYYEDTDLCRRLAVAGHALHVSPRLRAMHVENASTREFLGDGFGPLIARNRALFARRWMQERGADALVPGRDGAVPAMAAAIDPSRETAVVYTPFGITPGGGERYLLSAARALSATHRVVIATDGETSRARIQFICHALGIAPFAFSVATLREVLAGTRRPELTFVMGNEIVPPVPAFGRRNIYHLQFPFPWRNINRYDFQSIAAYDCLVVNSHYTSEWTQRRFAEVGVATPPPVHVVFPPVRLLAPTDTPRAAGPLRVVTVGRFFALGHSKRQDRFLDIVASARAAGVELSACMVGGVHNSPEAKAFFAGVEQRARAMRDVRLLVDASRHEVEQELRAADVYLHCAGLGVRTSLTPENAEHFGISVVEAISAGCFPLVAAAGGPLEIIRNAGVGASFGDIDEAMLRLRQLAEGGHVRPQTPPAWLAETSEAAFDRRLHGLIAGWAARPPREPAGPAPAAAARPQRGRVAA